MLESTTETPPPADIAASDSPTAAMVAALRVLDAPACIGFDKSWPEYRSQALAFLESDLGARALELGWDGRSLLGASRHFGGSIPDLCGVLLQPQSLGRSIIGVERFRLLLDNGAHLVRPLNLPSDTVPLWDLEAPQPS
jgi:hypothetical protein